MLVKQQHDAILPGRSLALFATSGGAEKRSEILSGYMPSVVVTRVPNVARRRSRNLEERIYVRFPFVVRRLAALVSRLNPSSRLRRTLLRRALVSGWGSFQRRDFELNFCFVLPDAEFEFPSGLQTLGLGGTFHGHEGRIEVSNKLIEIWGSELEPAYLLDLGDRLLNLGSWHTQAHGSGIALDQELAQLITLRDGLVIRDQMFFSWEEGLKAAGLDPDAIALPSRGKAPREGSATS